MYYMSFFILVSESIFIDLVMSISADLDMWGRQSSLPCADDKRVELTKKVGLKIRGSFLQVVV